MQSAQLLIVTGKGGVGKTAIAAALGSVLARRERRVLLLEADPRDNLHHLFGVEPSGGRVVAAAPHLAIQNANPRTILDDVVRDRLRFGALSTRVLASPIYQHFADGAPGLKEMMLLGYAMLAVERRKRLADLVIIDAPASGHSVSLLAAPQLVSGVITTGPLGAMAKKIAALTADPARCGVVLATLAEEMPVTETLETIAAIERGVDLVVVNQLWPGAQDAKDAQAQDAQDAQDALDAQDAQDTQTLWGVRRRMNQRELARLRRAWHGAIAVLPLVGAEFGPELLAALASALEGQLPDAAGSRQPGAGPSRRTRKRRA